MLAELIGALSESFFRSHSASLARTLSFSLRLFMCISGNLGCLRIWQAGGSRRSFFEDMLHIRRCHVGAPCFTEPLEDWLHRVRRQSPCSRVRPYLQPDPTSTETSDILRKDVAIIFAEQSRIVTCVLMESSSHGWHVSNALIRE